MTDDLTEGQRTAIDQGTLKEVRLYGATFDADLKLILHTAKTKAGDLAYGLVIDPHKTGPIEDAIGIVPLNGDAIVLLVADGVGGLPTGWKASGLVLEHIRDELAKSEKDDARRRTAILDGIEKANRTMLDLGTGTSTTLVAAIVRNQQVRTFHIGDSSAWICGQRGVMKLRTTPHSPIGMALEAGFVDEKEALHHEDLSLVSNVIGSADMRIEIGSYQSLAPKDTLLIASDGLFDNVTESEIVEIIRTGSIGECLLQLHDLTSKRMAGAHKNKPSKPDDFSAILFRPAAPASG